MVDDTQTGLVWLDTQVRHPLVIRTSPKGGPFLGTCSACGKRDISFKSMETDDCPNQRGMTNGQAILEAVS